MEKIESKIVLRNKLGLHARAATLLAELAMGFESDVKLRKDGREIDAKSLMAILTLAAGQGSELDLIVAGRDSSEAHSALVDLMVGRKFDEE